MVTYICFFKNFPHIWTLYDDTCVFKLKKSLVYTMSVEIMSELFTWFFNDFFFNFLTVHFYTKFIHIWFLLFYFHLSIYSNFFLLSLTICHISSIHLLFIFHPFIIQTSFFTNFSNFIFNCEKYIFLKFNFHFLIL